MRPWFISRARLKALRKSSSRYAGPLPFHKRIAAQKRVLIYPYTAPAKGVMGGHPAGGAT